MSPAQLRKRECLSIKRFAESVGTDAGTVWRWEHGKHKPTGITLTLLNLVERHGLRALLGGKLAQSPETPPPTPTQPVAPKRPKRNRVK